MNDTATAPTRRGRPSKLTREVSDAIVHAVRTGNYLDTAAAYAGVHPATVYRWLERADKSGAANAHYREFREALERARAEAEVRMVAVTLRAAQGGTVLEKTTRRMPDGTEIVSERFAPPDGRTALEYLARAFPDRWARRNSIEVTGADGGPVQIATVERLDALAGRVQAAIANVVDGEVLDDDEEGVA